MNNIYFRQAAKMAVKNVLGQTSTHLWFIIRLSSLRISIVHLPFIYRSFTVHLPFIYRLSTAHLPLMNRW
jgi:hypothetical protein